MNEYEKAVEEARRQGRLDILRWLHDHNYHASGISIPMDEEWHISYEDVRQSRQKE